MLSVYGVIKISYLATCKRKKNYSKEEDNNKRLIDNRQVGLSKIPIFFFSFFQNLNISLKTNTGYTPIHFASNYKIIKCVRIIPKKLQKDKYTKIKSGKNFIERRMREKHQIFVIKLFL